MQTMSCRPECLKDPVDCVVSGMHERSGGLCGKWSMRGRESLRGGGLCGKINKWSRGDLTEMWCQTAWFNTGISKW